MTDALEKLREEMRRRNLDGFLVPHADEHLNEYLPASAERLAWVSGFTGSAGTAVALRKKAALFIDGRYTLQARAEADNDAWSFHKVPEEKVSDWITANAAKGARIGHDPWLHNANQAAAFRKACERAGARLVEVDGNPIDAIWPDRPDPPQEPVVPHPMEFAGQSSADKRARVALTLTEARQDACVLAQPDSVAWLFNIRGADIPFSPLPLAFAILRADGSAALFLDPRKRTPRLDGHFDDAVALMAPEDLGAALDGLGADKARVRLDGEGTPAWIAERLRKAGAKLDRGDNPCAKPKAIKNPTELDGARAAHVRDGAAMARFLCWLAKTAPQGVISEIAAADRLEAFRAEGRNFRGLSFPTISGAGPNGAIVHYRVTPETDRALKSGSLYLVDSGAQYLDGTTDVTRTVAIGAPTAEMRDRFTRVLKGHIALSSARFVKGTTGSQLDILARRPLWEAGLDYEHGTGHGVGSYLSVHEGPHRIAKTPSAVALEPGMVTSNEPGYYKEGEYGIRIENLIAVVPADAPDGAERGMLGFEPLTLVPIDRALVAADMLTDAEKDWLNAYHARVLDAIAPLVDGETAIWLRFATASV